MEGQFSKGWKQVIATLDSVERGTAVILLLHGCDGMTTDIWSWRRLKDRYESLSIYLIVKESDKKLLDHIDASLRQPIISHWREGTDGFSYGRFYLADVVNCMNKDEDDLRYEDLLSTHLLSMWEYAFTSRLRRFNGGHMGAWLRFGRNAVTMVP